MEKVRQDTNMLRLPDGSLPTEEQIASGSMPPRLWAMGSGELVSSAAPPPVANRVPQFEAAVAFSFVGSAATAVAPGLEDAVAIGLLGRAASRSSGDLVEQLPFSTRKAAAEGAEVVGRASKGADRLGDSFTDSGAPVFHRSTSTRIGDDAVSARVQNNLAPADGFHDVVVHGQRHDAAGSLAYVGDSMPLNTEQVAAAILGNPAYGGQPIRLVTCHGASGGCTSMAADLSRSLGVDVVAASDIVEVSRLGGPAYAGNGGSWFRFSPDGGQSAFNLWPSR